MFLRHMTFTGSPSAWSDLRFVRELELGTKVFDAMEKESNPHPEATFPNDAEGTIFDRCLAANHHWN